MLREERSIAVSCWKGRFIFAKGTEPKALTTTSRDAASQREWRGEKFYCRQVKIEKHWRSVSRGFNGGSEEEKKGPFREPSAPSESVAPFTSLIENPSRGAALCLKIVMCVRQ